LSKHVKKKKKQEGARLKRKKLRSHAGNRPEEGPSQKAPRILLRGAKFHCKQREGDASGEPLGGGGSGRGRATKNCHLPSKKSFARLKANRTHNRIARWDVPRRFGVAGRGEAQKNKKRKKGGGQRGLPGGRSYPWARRKACNLLTNSVGTNRGLLRESSELGGGGPGNASRLNGAAPASSKKPGGALGSVCPAPHLPRFSKQQGKGKEEGGAH